MNKETLQLIEKLANKLGTTSEYLWSILIKQAFVSGIIDIIQYTLIILAAIYLIKLHIKFCSNKDSKWSYYKGKEALGIPMIIATIIMVILVLMMVFCFGDTITKFVNPQYWALHEILEQIKS